MTNLIKNSLTSLVSSVALIALVSGCASPSASNTHSGGPAVRVVTLTGSVNNVNVLQAVADIGQAAGLPEVTSKDTGAGVVEFGQYQFPDGQISAQVAILPGQKLQITVKDSPEAEKTADSLRAKIEEKLKSVAQNPVAHGNS